MARQRTFFARMRVGSATVILTWACVVCCSPGCANENTNGNANTTDTGDATESVSHNLPDTTHPANPEIPYETPAGEPARFALESGEIVAEYRGDFEGIRRITFDDYGLRERRVDSTVPASKDLKAIPPQKLTLIRPDWHGAYDLRSGEAKMMPNNAFIKYREAWRTMDKPLGEIALQRSNGTRVTDTVLLGHYVCRVYRQSNERFERTIWTWGGIPLREQILLKDGSDGSYIIEPVRIDLDVDVSGSLFEFPPGVTPEKVVPGR